MQVDSFCKNTPPSPLSYQVLMCPEHEMEKVNMYCEVCRRPVCHLCKLGGSHANHKVTSMSNAYKILKVPPSGRAPRMSLRPLGRDSKQGRRGDGVWQLSPAFYPFCAGFPLP